MGDKKPKPHLQKSFIQQQIENKPKLTSISNDVFLVSFRHLDKTQGDMSETWDFEHMLFPVIDLFHGYCQRALRQQVDNTKFTIYGGFPPKDKTDFKFPSHVPEDAEWARIHITGKQCIIGHVTGNIFNVVFFDGSHSFWKSELKNT